MERILAAAGLTGYDAQRYDIDGEPVIVVEIQDRSHGAGLVLCPPAIVLRRTI